MFGVVRAIKETNFMTSFAVNDTISVCTELVQRHSHHSAKLLLLLMIMWKH